jgi:hypothetical protein
VVEHRIPHSGRVQRSLNTAATDNALGGSGLIGKGSAREKAKAGRDVKAPTTPRPALRVTYPTKEAEGRLMNLRRAETVPGDSGAWIVKDYRIGMT